MAATLAHEINNPLESVTNLIYLARETEGIPESARQYLKDADEELDRVRQMTKQTLGLYRESTKSEPLLVSGLLKGLLAMYSPRIKTRQIRTDLKVVSEIEVCGLKGELRQVFSNLLSNSIDAVGTDGIIRLRVAAAHSERNGRRGGVRVMVADNGPGISAANVKKIFEPFFTTKMNVGTGLGLWVSKEIVEQHGGSIRLRSCTMHGKNWTVASVFLPEDKESEEKELA
jgi:signal transduction histidine kinase